MLNRMNNQWSGKALYGKVKNGSVNFDNYVQRHYVWDNAKNSLLIHSILTGYPIPPFYMAKNGDQYDALDGKQRSHAIVSFMDDGYLLGLDDDYQEVDGIIIDGKKFSELPEEFQDRIKDVSLTIYFFDGITDDEIEEMFFRLNNGKPLSAIELTRVKAKSFDIIKRLAAHDLFNVALTDKAKEKYSNEDIVIKTYLTLFEAEPSHMTKDVRAIMSSVDITDEQVEVISIVFDKILAAYNSIEKTALKIAKKMLKRTHLVSLTRIASQIDLRDLVSLVLGFFDGKHRAASVSESYNANCKHGVAKPESIAKRLKAIDDYYDTNIKPNAAVVRIREAALASVPEANIEPVKTPPVEQETEPEVEADFDDSLPSLEELERHLKNPLDEEVAAE